MFCITSAPAVFPLGCITYQSQVMKNKFQEKIVNLKFFKIYQKLIRYAHEDLDLLILNWQEPCSQ